MYFSKYTSLLTIILCGFSEILGSAIEPIDLTWGFDNSTIYWPGSQHFKFTKQIASSENGYWYAIDDFCAGEHGGTHMDAPYHFYSSGMKVGEIPLDNLIVPGITIDISTEVEEIGHSARLEKSHLLKWTEEHGEFPEKSALLVRFGWSKHFHNRTMYLGFNETDNTLNFPGISTEAATWIKNSGRIVGVGVDTASVDPGSSKTFGSHVILCEAQIYLMENVKIPAELPACGYTLLIMPMKITEGTGAPLRIVAVQKL